MPSRWFGRRRSHRARLHDVPGDDLIRALALSPDGVTFSRVLIEGVLSHLQVDAARLGEYDEVREIFTVERESGERVGRPTIHLSGTGPLATWLTTNRRTLTLPDVSGAHAFLGDDEARQLHALDVRACVPIFAHSALAAILLISARASAFYLTQADLQWLGDVSRHAGVAREALSRHRETVRHIESWHQAQRLAVAGQLAVSVAHEVRNPLMAIRSSVQLALDESIPWERRRALLGPVIAATDRIEKTMADILSLSRPIEARESSFDLFQCSLAASSLIAAFAESCGATIEADHASVPVPVRADEPSIRQVFLNLFMNACQAMPSGGKVQVRSMVISESDPGVTVDWAVVDVTDSGQGMSADTLAQVFDLLFTTRSAGSGLGLPICLEIVTRHHGRLTIQSEQGAGTRARVMLPLCRTTYGPDPDC